MQPTDPYAARDSGRPSAALLSEADVALYVGFVEAATRDGPPDAVERFFSADFVEHGALRDRGGGELASSLAARRERFPDAEWTIELLAGVNGLVVCHTTMTWAATGGVARAWEMVVARVEAGRIAECWRVCDERLRAAEDGVAGR